MRNTNPPRVDGGGNNRPHIPTNRLSVPRRPAFTLDAVSSAELAGTDYTADFLVDGVLVDGQPAFIGGNMKSCKTLLAVDLAISLAAGQPFLGTFPVVESRRVGFLSGEGGLSVLQDYATRVAASKGLGLADVSGLVWSDRLPRLDNRQHLAALGAFLLEHEIGVVVFDPLYMCCPGGRAENLMVQGEVLGNLLDACRDRGATPVLVHHLRKNRQQVDAHAPPQLADLAWAGFGEFAAQWLLVGRRTDYNANQPGEHHLWLNVGGRAGHSGLYPVDISEGSLCQGRFWQPTVLSRAEIVVTEADAKRRHQAERVEEDALRLRHALRNYPDGETKTILRNAANLPTKRFNTALNRLLDDNEVEPCDIIKPGRNTPYSGYRLAEG